ncbi:hypothetical protein [Oryzobacter terrae]|uniref:hypothetical protein n=1 Tax=Oryzobacter terrae TaxID=1620385 RepID=UPI00366BC8EA
MSPPLRPLPGDPGAVRALARSLRSTGQRLGAIGSTLARLRPGPAWEGCAAEAFTSRIGDVPPLVDAVARRFAGAAAPLLALAEAMEDAQAVIGGAVLDDDAASHAYAALEDRVALFVASGRTEDDPDVLVLRHLQRDQVAQQVRARARHAAALERFREADASAAGVLRALAFDDLADSTLYRTLAAVRAGGRGVAEVGVLAAVAPELVPLAAAGDATATAADAGLLAVYGEGDAGSLATGLALASTGGVGRVLRHGSLAGAEATAHGVRSTRVLTTQQRMVVGAVEAARSRRDALRTALRGVPDRGTPSALLGGPAVRVRSAPVATAAAQTVAQRASDAARLAAERVREAAAEQVRRRVLDDWRLASANGASAQRMYVSGATLEVAGAAGTRAHDHERQVPTVTT